MAPIRDPDADATPPGARLKAILTATVTPESWARNLLSASIIFFAAIPFAGWRLPAIWLAAMVVLIGGEVAWERNSDRLNRDTESGAINPFRWLLNAVISVAATYLVLFCRDSALTLGVTLFGVVIFQILARDHDAPRRLTANLMAPVTSLVVVQVAAAGMLLRDGLPWHIITLVASPLVVLGGYRTVQFTLDRRLRLERQALLAAMESEHRYRVMAEHSPDVILRYDLDGRLEYISPACRHYGYDPVAMVGQNVAEFLDPDEVDRNVEYRIGIAEGREPLKGEKNIWRCRDADGRRVAFESATSPITDREGRIVGAMAAMRDVTTRLTLEEELRKKREEAEAAVIAKGQFLANMSHEIRTPLTGVIGFAGLLEAMKDLPPAAQQYAARIHSSAEALLNIVNDILDFSKLEAEQFEIGGRPFSPAGLVEDTVGLVRVQADQKGLQIAVDPMPSIPACLVGDGQRIRQVFLNLLTNAVKFTEAGEVRVSAAYDSADRRLKIAVKDTGIGIPAEFTGRLFQRFSQIDGSNTRRYGGSGLGLAICKGLVEIMGGEIGVDSQPGIGSTFWFTVSVAPAEAAPPEEAPGPTPLDVRRLSLLVVDDVTTNRELVTAMLAPFGVQITEAVNGAAALEATGNQAFDLILMDLQMPVMDGLSATAAIRASANVNSRTPILALSANVLPAQIEACRLAGMDDHIAKPINPGELLAKVAQWTDREPGAADQAVKAVGQSAAA